MLDFENQARKEIWQAKKLLYESDDNTKRSFIFLVGAFVSLALLLCFSFAGTDDTWTCEIESSNNRGHYICQELRRNLNCKTISGPIRSEIFIKLKNNVQASAIVECPWEIAISELRFCFILLGIISVVTGLYSLKKSNKKYAQLSFQCGVAFSVLLIISAYFDHTSVSVSQINNYNLCNLQEEFEVEDQMKGKMECSVTFYNITVYLELLSAGLLVSIDHLSQFVSSLHLNTWRKAQQSVDSL